MENTSYIFANTSKYEPAGNICLFVHGGYTFDCGEQGAHTAGGLAGCQDFFLIANTIAVILDYRLK